MNLRRRRILVFALGFGPPFVISVCLYPFILPTYQRTVLATVNACLAMLSPVSEVRSVLTGQWQILVHRPLNHVVTYGLKSANIGLLTFFQQVVLSALLLATPVKLKERVRLFACGIGMMFGLHVLCVAGCAYGMAVIDDSKSALFRSLPLILGPFASGLAVVVWGLLTWRYWLSAPDLMSRHAEESVGGRQTHATRRAERRLARARHQP